MKYVNLCFTFVYQEDCSQQDTGPDELAQKSADDLDDLDMDMDMVVQEEDVVDGITPAPHYLSQSRSLSRLSKIDTHRVRDTTFCQFYTWACFVFFSHLLNLKAHFFI